MSPCSLLSVHLVARAELFLLLTKEIPHAFCIPAAPVYPKCFPSNSPFSPPFFFPSLHMSTCSVSSAYKPASDLFFFFSSIFTLLSGLYNLLPGLLQWLPNGFSYIYLLLVPHTVCSHHSSQKELFKTCQVVMNAPSSKILTESPCHSEWTFNFLHVLQVFMPLIIPIPINQQPLWPSCPLLTSWTTLLWPQLSTAFLLMHLPHFLIRTFVHVIPILEGIFHQVNFIFSKSFPSFTFPTSPALTTLFTIVATFSFPIVCILYPALLFFFSSIGLDTL